MSAETATLDQGDRKQLAELYEELPIDELLDLDEPWTVKDVPLDDVNRTKGVVNQLRWANAIEEVGERTIERKDTSRKTRTIIEYRVTESAREFLQDYVDERPTLPCGHRSHIHHRSGGGFGCRWCEDAQFDREIVEEVMA